MPAPAAPQVPTAPFGSTGHRSSRVIFGGAALGAMRQERADALLEVLLAAGVNHLDVAASYGDAELRVAPWLARHPGRFFVATKTGDRRGVDARASLERSLERMGVDHVDLIQLHNLVEPDEWRQAFAADGAVAALAAARDEGLCRFIGVTGHGMRIAGMHLRSLDAFPFDSVLLPANAALLADPGYRDDFTAVVERCAERGVAVQVIKALARRRWSDDQAGPRFAWYEPLPPEATEEIGRAVRVVLSRPGLFLNSSSDARLLDPTLVAAAGADATVAPHADDLAADAERLGVRPLFDGDALERI
ncbi:MAG TPA: aldo/keto reductase [Acidimicrobiales bacterium]|nr:aldo/keto reductase [Acidimicrobiales bacterium]